MGTVEVETGESVNAIEARAEWGVYSKLKVPLHLYVPPASVDTVKRLCAEYQIVVAELWTYTTSFDQVRFNMVYRSPDAPVVKVPVVIAKPAPKVAAPKVAAPKPAASKPKSAATLRQAQSRPEQSRGTKKAAPAKTKPKAKAKPAAKKARPAPKAKPKKGAKKRR
jgi:hypothetical protein